MAHFNGTFKYTSQENFDDYMKAIGVGMAMRAVARAASPSVTFEVNGNEWTQTTTGLKETVNKFTLGVEKDEETADGRKVKSTYTLDGDKLIQKESWKDKVATYVREVVGDELIVTITLDDIRCVRKYKRV